MITEGHELCKRTSIRIREVGNYRPGKQWSCIFWKPVHEAWRYSILL